MTFRQKALATLVVVFGALHFVDTGSHRERNFEYVPEMVYPVPYESQGENPLHADGKTLQTPPVGTIPRGLLPLHVGETMLELNGNWKELTPESKAAWNSLKAPAPANETKAAKAADLARGEKLFRRVCATCHGGAGAGDGVVTKRGVPPPPSLKADAQRAMSDGRMFRVITRGEGNMASHAIHVARKDRWKVIRYVRTLQ